MQKGWFYQTRWGLFGIQPQSNGRYQVTFEGDGLGSYHHPAAALDDLVGDHCFSNRKSLDTSQLGLPVDLSEWTLMR